MRLVRLGLRLGLFQLSLGSLSVLTLGLLNRLLIQDFEMPAALVALAIGTQELMGFSRAWFGHRSDRRPVGVLRRTPFLIGSSLAVSLLLGAAIWVVLQLAQAKQTGLAVSETPWLVLLTLVFVGLGTAISAGGTAFSALIVDLTSERERTRLLAVVWSLRLLGVLLTTTMVGRLFGQACEPGASSADILLGLERLMVTAPPILFVLGLVAVVGVESRAQSSPADSDNHQPLSLSLPQLLGTVFVVPQVKRFMAVMCLFTFSMFLNDAVLEPYGAALFGMNICETTSLNALLAIGFLAGLLISGFQVVPRFGMLRGSQTGAVMASLSLALMLFAAPEQWQFLLRISIGLFGLSLGLCIHSCLNLMFNFVQPGLNAVLMGVWGMGYAYARGLATISGGGLLTLFQTITGDDPMASYGGVLGLQILLFLTAALLINYLDVQDFRRSMKLNLAQVMQTISD